MAAKIYIYAIFIDQFVFCCVHSEFIEMFLFEELFLKYFLNVSIYSFFSSTLKVSLSNCFKHMSTLDQSVLFGLCDRIVATCRDPPG